MGYWATSLTGASLQTFGDLNPDGSEMLWGDAPADRIDDGLHKLILRLRDELGRFPTVAEVDAVKATAPEMTEAIAEAILVFHDDIERQPTDGEINAGLAFADTGISLDSAMRADIHVGDKITWPVRRDLTFGQEIDYIAEGTVARIGTRDAEGILGTYPQTYYEVVDRDGMAQTVDKPWATKVLPGDKSVDEINAERKATTSEL